MIPRQTREERTRGKRIVVFSGDNGGERFSRNLPLFPSRRRFGKAASACHASCAGLQKLPKGKTSTSQMAITMDLHATFAAIAGAKTPPEKPLDGIDLLPLLTSDAKPIDRTSSGASTARNPQTEGHPPRQMEIASTMATRWTCFDSKPTSASALNLGYQHPEIVEDLKSVSKPGKRRSMPPSGRFS